MGISNVIALLSGIALFLFGMALMGDGLKRVAELGADPEAAYVEASME